ncbi:MAG: hypothetical protein IKJ77_06315 [Firmicutes bacterium]|nr:hypothetical protein [Bacillota bacterium]
MFNKNRLEIAILVKNSFSLACFTGLAMFFGKWWIVLFALLFWTTLKEQDEVRKDGKEN